MHGFILRNTKGVLQLLMCFKKSLDESGGKPKINMDR